MKDLHKNPSNRSDRKPKNGERKIDTLHYYRPSTIGWSIGKMQIKLCYDNNVRSIDIFEYM